MALMLPFSAQAGIIRDAEIENTLAAYSRPILAAAGIPADSVRIMIVGSPEVNAFVAGGLNIFINTGLIRETKNPGMLIGVIAHETGHISGAHLSQFREKASRAMLGSLIGAAASIAVAASGGGKAAPGILAGSQSMAQRQFLSEIRMNEQSADHAALKFLDANDISASGMLETFEMLHAREIGGVPRDKYLLSHPLSSERVATVRNHLAQSTIPKGQVPAGFNDMHARMVAKLVAFLEPYATTLKLYPVSDTSVAARYARAIAEYKHSHLEEALAGINALIKNYPKDPYFYDTKGQMLFENGRVAEASAAYAKASSLKSDSALLMTEYAKTLIALNKPAELPKAIALLERSKELDDSYAVTWRQLAMAYGKQGKLGFSYAALAEEAALNGDLNGVFQHIARARKDTSNDSTLLLELDDLERDAKNQLEKRKKQDSIF